MGSTMRLFTEQFGSIGIEPRRIIVLPAGLDGDRTHRQWILLADKSHPSLWWLQSVYVAPEVRGRGVFRKLYRHVRDAAADAGAAGVRLYVADTNVTAQGTYARLGMHPTAYLIYETPATEW